MDFFALPDVVIRHLMRKLELRDRARLRLTCRDGVYISLFSNGKLERALERLVAATHAGFFFKGSISRSKDDGCSPQESIRSLEFIRAITDGMEIKNFSFDVDSASQLGNALQLMSDFPNSKYRLSIHVLDADHAKILLIPSTEKLRISLPIISTEFFFKLLNKHRNLILLCNSPDLTYRELMETLQIVSNDEHSRTVRLNARNSTIVEFEIILADFEDPFRAHIILRYRRCWIDIVDFDWLETNRISVPMMLSNVEIRETTIGWRAFMLRRSMNTI